MGPSIEVGHYASVATALLWFVIGLIEKGILRLMKYKTILKNLAIEKELVLEFFVVFSRFEYALKRSGFVIKNPKELAKKNAIDAKPDWTGFAKTIAGKIRDADDEPLCQAITLLTEAPPKKQMFSNEKDLHWEPTDEQGIAPLETDLLVLVPRVRNNLFHGGKYPDGPFFDPKRDEKLLRAGITIMERCLKLDEELNGHFWSKP